MNTPNLPVERLRVGNVQLTIWRNEGKEGSFYSCAVEAAYKDGDEWRASNRYGLSQLVHLAKVALLAHSTIVRLRAKPERSQDDGLDNVDPHTEAVHTRL